MQPMDAITRHQRFIVRPGNWAIPIRDRGKWRWSSVAYASFTYQVKTSAVGARENSSANTTGASYCLPSAPVNSRGTLSIHNAPCPPIVPPDQARQPLASSKAR